MKNNPETYDFAVVGGGIVGLAMAWAAARNGQSTILVERHRPARGASIRNFGMVWPIGQPAGDDFDMAIRSRELWLTLRDEANVWVNACGSLHLIREDDELAVVEEFMQTDPRHGELKMLTANEVATRSPGANLDGLQAALWSPMELCVNPPEAIRSLTRWLVERRQVEVRQGLNIVNVCDQQLTCSDGTEFQAERIAVCSGSDFETLFPQHFQNAGLSKCKLQMLATRSQPDDWRLGPHLAGGLTLRHYRAFADCPSLSLLKNRVATEKPLLDRYGIHVMASQNNAGEVILGDSHLYDDDITPFDSAEIDELILQELNSLVRLPSFEIARRWHGVYAKHREQTSYVVELAPNCRIVTGLGGAGMTLSFAVAERVFDTWH